MLTFPFETIYTLKITIISILKIYFRYGKDQFSKLNFSFENVRFGLLIFIRLSVNLISCKHRSVVRKLHDRAVPQLRLTRWRRGSFTGSKLIPMCQMNSHYGVAAVMRSPSQCLMASVLCYCVANFCNSGKT